MKKTFLITNKLKFTIKPGDLIIVVTGIERDMYTDPNSKNFKKPKQRYSIVIDIVSPNRIIAMSVTNSASKHVTAISASGKKFKFSFSLINIYFLNDEKRVITKAGKSSQLINKNDTLTQILSSKKYLSKKQKLLSAKKLVKDVVEYDEANSNNNVDEDSLSPQ